LCFECKKRAAKNIEYCNGNGCTLERLSVFRVALKDYRCNPGDKKSFFDGF